MSMLNLIKQAGLDAYGASNPVIIQFGVVSEVDPLEVIVDQRFPLTEDFLIVPESLTRLEVNLQHSHSYSDGTTGNALNEPIVIRRGLESGDKVILIRMQGGQKYLIIDRVVSA